MSKLTDIQYRIDQLDGGAFQNLCDAYFDVQRLWNRIFPWNENGHK